MGHRAAVHALQRYLLVRAADRALGQPDHAHATLADRFDQPVIAGNRGFHVPLGSDLAGHRADYFWHGIQRVVLRGQDQPVRLGAEPRVVTTQRVEPGGAFGQRQLQHLVHDLLRAGVARGLSHS